MQVLTFFAVMAAILFLTHRQFTRGLLRAISPATQNSIKGEWVGHLDITGIQPRESTFVPRQAVVRFTLSTQDFFLENYGGEGEITIQSEPPRHIRISKLSFDNRGGDPGSFHTDLVTFPPSRDPNDPLSANFSGHFTQGQSLSMYRDDIDGFEMKGVLTKGSDADYAALVQQMNATR